VGPDRGQRVSLSPAQRELVRKIYDTPDGSTDPNAVAALCGPELSAFLVLACIVGIRAARDSAIDLDINADIDLIWAAASDPALRSHLEKHGNVISVPELGTRYPEAA
jgi:hypothetical protein